MTATHLSRATSATIIPAGDVVELPSGTAVTIVQTLGANVTVRTDHGLFRIAAVDTEAIMGYEATAPQGGAEAVVGEFNEAAVWAALKTCFDPEIPLNIVDLGLIYDLAITQSGDGSHHVEVKMTLTAPGCGMGPVIAGDARDKILALPTVSDAQVHVVWDPTWAPQMISAEGRRVLWLE